MVFGIRVDRQGRAFAILREPHAITAPRAGIPQVERQGMHSGIHPDPARQGEIRNGGI